MKDAGTDSVKSANTSGAQSIQRAVAVLRAVAKHNERGERLSMIARNVGLHVATARRILHVLCAEGLITYDPVSKLYHLGLVLFQLGTAAHQFAIRDRFRTSLERIARETADTVFLLIRAGNDVLCIDRAEGGYHIRTITIDVGARRPLGIGVGSLALIAFLPDQEFESIVSANEARYPHYRNLTAEKIRNLARSSQSSGYVVSEGLFHEGVTSVGIPIRDNEQVVASITVAAISRRMGPKRRGEIVHLVKTIVAEVFPCRLSKP